MNGTLCSTAYLTRIYTSNGMGDTTLDGVTQVPLLQEAISDARPFVRVHHKPKICSRNGVWIPDLSKDVCPEMGSGARP